MRRGRRADPRSPGSSVFYTPVRDVVRVSRSGEEYVEANETNHGVTGSGLSIQAWNSAPKITGLDAFLRADGGDGRVGTVLKSHPGCCFLSPNGQPLAYSKSTEVRLAQRRQLLDRANCREDGGTEAVYREALEQYPRSELARGQLRRPRPARPSGARSLPKIFDFRRRRPRARRGVSR